MYLESENEENDDIILNDNEAFKTYKKFFFIQVMMKTSYRFNI